MVISRFCQPTFSLPQLVTADFCVIPDMLDDVHSVCAFGQCSTVPRASTLTGAVTVSMYTVHVYHISMSSDVKT